MKKYMSMNTQITVPVAKFRARISQAFEFLIREPRGAVVITKNGKEKAVLITVEEFFHLKRLEDKEEERWLIGRIEEAEKTPRGEGSTIEEVMAELGITEEMMANMPRDDE